MGLRFLGYIAGGFGVGFALKTCAGSSHPVHAYNAINNPRLFDYDPKGRSKRKAFTSSFKPYTLGEIVPISHDVALFRFLLHDHEDEFNLRPCSTLQACFRTGAVAAEQCQRFYTPVTPNHTKGYFDIIVKRKKNGRMTDHVFGMHVGDDLLFRAVSFKVQYRPNKWRHIGMLAGGTGFTPMLQVVRHALTEYAEDKTKMSLLLCNQTENDVLLRGVFDDLMEKNPDRFQVKYCVDRALDPATWDGYTGYVTTDMVKDFLPAPADDIIIMLCGPDGFLAHVADVPAHMTSIMSGSKHVQPIAPDINNLVGMSTKCVLGKLGYNTDHVYKF